MSYRELLIEKERRKVITEEEIRKTMLKPISKEEDVVCRWNNKCRSIKQRQKGLRRIDKHMKRLKKLAEPF